MTKPIAGRAGLVLVHGCASGFAACCAPTTFRFLDAFHFLDVVDSGGVKCEALLPPRSRLGLVSGLAGATSYSWLFDEAGAAPIMQAREDQITIYSGGTTFAFLPQSSQYVALENVYTLIAIDPSDYQSSATFRLEAQISEGDAQIHNCVRLFDTTASAPVSGTEVCNTIGGMALFRSGPFTLQMGQHTYSLQGKCSDPSVGCGAAVLATRVIAEWVERR